ncbi:hypothetical protein [Aliarcobacter butzleri]|uniref:hypothetical protein n=1 Tax=Aliarcobacter butzleri TaxID=28197 RepID=UPI00186A082B|nr:hypothetical protein [Aliarcobacter butzleri]
MEYIVRATMVIEFETVVEASSQDEAWEIAQEIDGGNFKEIKNSKDWNIHSVYEKLEKN